VDAGDLVELEVTAAAHGGVFVARHEGRVVFVPDAIPGERIRAVLTDTRKSAFWRADAVEVLDASPDRRAHVWTAADIDVPPADRPGGADFGHIRLDRQREIKRELLAESVHRFGGLDVPVSIAPAGEADDGTRWRTRVSLHVDDAGTVGPVAARSHRVIPVTELPLATDAIARAAQRLHNPHPGRVDLVQPADGRVRVIPRPDATPTHPTRGPRRGRRSGDRPHTPAPREASEVVIERAGGRAFRVDAGGFWQVHRFAADALTDLVGGRLRETGVDPDAANLDLYGGVGLFAATLGDVGGPTTRVVSVESDPRATEHAGENLAEWVGARAETARVDRWIGRLVSDASVLERTRLARGVVVLDPPRSGAGKDVAQAVAALEPAAVVYVACDPVALGRDLATFAAAGYRPDRIDGLDLFPNSHHVEAVAVLRR